MIVILLFCIALSVDVFVAGVIYGADRLRIPFRKIAVMNAIGTLCLGAALCLGSALELLVPDFLTKVVCVVSLFLLGMIRLLDSLIKNYIHRHCDMQKNIQFSVSQLRIILQIYADPSCADLDNDRTLSLKESVSLGFAMSIDSLAAGTFAAFMEISAGWTLLFSFLLGVGAMSFGQWIGKQLARHLGTDLSWLGGIFFLLLAFLNAFG